MAKKPEATNFDKLLEELNGAKKAGADGTVEAAPVQKKSGFVTLIGRPNVGKSTLMNHLIGQKIAITSDKPQTTRNRIQTVYTDERGQIIFLDTPGIHKAKNKLGEYMVNVAEHTLKEVDLILWLVEPSTFIGAGERHIAEQLQGIKTPIILVINKTDTVKNQEDTSADPAAEQIELLYPVSRYHICQYSVAVRYDDETAAVTLPDGGGGKYAGRLPVYFKCPGSDR